jgi:hypothetical protein
MRSRMIAVLATSFLASIPTPSLAQDKVGEPVFRVPLGQVVPSTSVDPVYGWIEASTPCSTTCGTGTRTTSFQCQDMSKFDTVAGNFGPPEADGQCTSAVGNKPAGSTSSCTVFAGCGFDWVKPPEVVTPVPVGSNPVGRPGCGQIQREFNPRCERSDGTVMADGDHTFCRNDRPDYDDVAAGLPDALGYDRTGIETSACNTTDHDWIIGNWSAWSSTCSTTALRTRTVSCQRRFDASAAPDSSCAGPKPATSDVSGQYGSCTFTAEFGAWSGWSSDCSASSNRTRSVQCRRSNGDIVGLTECSSRGIAVAPTSETSARYGSCTYSRVNPDAWSAWSSTCSANATRSRSYDCRRSDGTIVSDSECTSRGINLSENETGAVYSGCSYAWQTGAWSAYNSTCSSTATRTRSVTCQRNPLGTTVPDSNCTGSRPAASDVSAQYGGCGYSAVNWTGWSAWSSSCSASATRSQTAQCRRSDGSIVAASECTGRGIALTQAESGAVYSGCSYSVSFGAWTSWSSTCSASASRTRSATCYRSDGAVVPAAECSGRGIALDPVVETGPQYGGCSYSASFGSWSSCSSGTQTRTVACYRSDGSAVATSYCGYSGSPASEQRSCASYAWNTGDWSSWSTCEADSQFRTRSVVCTATPGGTVADSNCGSGKPASSETQSCTSAPTIWIVVKTRPTIPCTGSATGGIWRVNTGKSEDDDRLNRRSAYTGVMRGGRNTICISEDVGPGDKGGKSYTFRGYSGLPLIPTPDPLSPPRKIDPADIGPY